MEAAVSRSWQVAPRATLVEKSQKRQADFLAFAVGQCKERFPRCSGVLIWMGHDCMPVGSNTSIINYDGTPKPAYHAIKKFFLE